MNAKKLGFGLMRLPMMEVNGESVVDIEKCKGLVDRFIEKGFTYFDTAWMYCNFNSENAVKELLVKRHPRESFTLTTKLHGGFIKTKEDRDNIFNTQLKKTGAGYFDYYLIHDVNSRTIKTYEELDCFTWIQQKKAEGLVKHIGFSFHDGPELLEKVLSEHPEFEYVQLQINYLDWESTSVQSRKCYEIAQKYGKPVIVMEPVKGGTLAKVPEEVEKLFKDYNKELSVPSWAIRFAAGLPGVCMVLSGMNTMEQLEDNMAVTADLVPFNEDENRLVKLAADIINGNIVIPCTGCEYCVSGCPENIPVPEYFSLYNTDKKQLLEKKTTSNGSKYSSLADGKGKASDCIGCKKCEKVCPQHLPVTKYLKDVAEHFEK